MPEMSPEQWKACRSEYEMTAISVRALCRKYGLSTGTISQRIARDGWKKDEDALAAIAAAARYIPPSYPGDTPPTPPGQGGGQGGGHQGADTPSVETSPTDTGSDAQKVGRTAPDEVRTPLVISGDDVSVVLPAIRTGDPVKDAVAETVRGIVVVETEKELRRIDALEVTYDAYHAALKTFLTGDRNGQEWADAAALILAGRNDSVAGTVQAVTMMRDKLHTNRRRALGLEQPTKHQHAHLHMGAQPGAPGAADVPPADQRLPDLSKMDTAQLEALYSLGLVIEGEKERPPVPVPPGGPVVLPETSA